MRASRREGLYLLVVSHLLLELIKRDRHVIIRKLTLERLIVTFLCGRALLQLADPIVGVALLALGRLPVPLGVRLELGDVLEDGQFGVHRLELLGELVERDRAREGQRRREKVRAGQGRAGWEKAPHAPG